MSLGSVAALLIVQLPGAAVVIAGICVAVARRHRHPQVSLLTVLGLALIGLPGLASVSVQLLSAYGRADGYSNGFYMPLYQVVIGIASLLGTVGVALLVVAALSWRRPPPPEPATVG